MSSPAPESSMPDSAVPVLVVDDLRTHFHTRDGTVRAVDGVSFDLSPGETLCVVGESGCGKSVTALSILGLLPVPPASIESGKILFEGEDLVQASEERLREIRGNSISMIFQEPMTSLNPGHDRGRSDRRGACCCTRTSTRARPGRGCWRC